MRRNQSFILPQILNNPLLVTCFCFALPRRGHVFCCTHTTQCEWRRKIGGKKSMILNHFLPGRTGGYKWMCIFQSVCAGYRRKWILRGAIENSRMTTVGGQHFSKMPCYASFLFWFQWARQPTPFVAVTNTRTETNQILWKHMCRSIEVFHFLCLLFQVFA